MLISDRDPSSLAEYETRLASGGGDILEITGDADWRELAEPAKSALQIDIRFDSFKDGRGFTLANQLRERLGFQGLLRAKGDLIPDQAQFLRRVGFDSVEPDRTDLSEDWARALQRFSVTYQPARENAARPEVQTPSLATLNERYMESDAIDILHDAITKTWKGKVAVLSSFGAEAAVNLHLVSRIDPDIPVLFLDTGRHFAQTEQYMRQLSEELGLTNVRILNPDADEVAAEDADNKLWQRDADACCALRRVRPLNKALEEFDALITGRKQFHGGARINLPAVEQINGRVRVNPLTRWSQDDINAYFKRYNLPQHPLVEMGYTSIGCWTCTAPAQAGEDPRAGRWPGQDKTECGIHVASMIQAAE